MAISGIINTNINSLFTQNALNNTAGALNQALQRLSTGLKINGPADDPAGYSIAQRFTTQINGLNQAISNANQAVSLVQTATGALQQSTNLLQQIRTIAVQAANGSNSDSDRQALQNVVTQLQSQINTIAKQTQFNGQNLLDGTFSGNQFQVGANANQILNVSIGNAQGNAVGVNQSQANTTSGAFSSSSGVADGTLAYTISAGGNFTAGSFAISGSAGSASVSVTSVDESAASVAAAINGNTKTTNVSATANTSVAFTVTTGSIAFTLGNGQAGTGITNSVNISANITSTSDLSGLVSAINNQTATTGVTASVNSAGKLVMTNSDGHNINIQGFNGTGTLASTAGGVTLASGGTTSTLVQGLVSLNSTDGFALSTGASNVGLQTSSKLNSVSSVNVATAAGANAAINIIDFAIAKLNQQGSLLGAVQQRVQASLSNLQTTATNLTAARSAVQDANLAQETSEMTKNQILQQAGISTLAQANQLQQSFLKLLP